MKSKLANCDLRMVERRSNQGNDRRRVRFSSDMGKPDSVYPRP